MKYSCPSLNEEKKRDNQIVGLASARAREEREEEVLMTSREDLSDGSYENMDDTKTVTI